MPPNVFDQFDTPQQGTAAALPPGGAEDGTPPWQDYQRSSAPPSVNDSTPPWQDFQRSGRNIFDQFDAPAMPRRGVQAIPVGGTAQAPLYVDQSPAAATTPREYGITERVRGGVEAALSAIAGLPLGAFGLAGGVLGGVAGAISTGKWQPDEILRSGTEAAERVMAPVQPRTEAGREYSEGVNAALQETVPLIGAPHLPAGGLRTATRAAADTAPAFGRGLSNAAARAGNVVADAVTPSIDPAKAELAGKAIDAGIPLRPDMLSDNKFLRHAGEFAENSPFTGGKGKARHEAFSEGLHQLIDPDGKGKLTPAAYDAAMTKAGQEIGDISARTPVPLETLKNLDDLGRRETPDVQKVLSAYADDVRQAAADNGGTVPGETFRKLRSEAAAQARSSTNGDLRNALGNFVKRMDDALSDVAPEADLDALADARRRYAVGMALQDVVAKASNGDINPALILGRTMSNAAGKRRMARGKGGDLGDYARIGQEFLKEQPSSGTAERHLIMHAVTHGVSLVGAIPAALYNRLGPRIARRMIERERARNAPPPEAPPPELSAEQAPFEPQGPAPRDARLGDPRLGDITPEWQTEAGAAPAGPRQEVVPAEGLVRAVDEPAPAQEPGLRMLSEDEYPRQPAGNGIDFVAEPELAGVQPPDWTLERGAGAARAPGVDATDLTPALGDARTTTGQNRTRAGRDIPAVEGLPGVDDVAVAGNPGDFVDAAPGSRGRLAERPRPASEPTDMGNPISDPRLQEIDRLKAEATSDVVRKALDEQAKAVQKDIDAKAKADKARADADEMRALAAKTEDPGLKKALQEQAEKLSPAEKTAEAPKADASSSEERQTGTSTASQRSPIDISSDEFSAVGDDMEALRNLARNHAKKHFAGLTVENESDKSPIKIAMSGIRHATSGTVSKTAMVAMSRLDALVKTAKFAGEEADNRGRPDIKGVRFYDRDVVLNGKPATVRVVVRVTNSGSRYYDHFDVRENPPQGLPGGAAEPLPSPPFTEGPPRDGSASVADKDAQSLADWVKAQKK